MKHKSIFLSLTAIISIITPYAIIAETVSVSENTVINGKVMPVKDMFFPICPLETNLLPGETGNNIKTLQSILSQDSLIYPEGIVSGYYGELTKEAVKRFQKRSGIPTNGIVDNDTRILLFPCMTLRITAPNGGEEWKINETHQITWKVDAPYYIQNQNSSKFNAANGMLHPVTNEDSNTPPQNAVYPFFKNLSIDLIKTDDPRVLSYPYLSQVYYHIGSASLYGENSFSWNIPQTILESKNYKIRISLWKNAPEPFGCKSLNTCVMAPSLKLYPIEWKENLWDESDNTFSILGGVNNPPTPKPDLIKLKKLRAELQQVLENIKQSITTLDELIASQ